MTAPIILAEALSAQDEAALPGAVSALMRHPAVILYRTESDPNRLRVLARGRVEESAAGLAILPLARDPELHRSSAAATVGRMEMAAGRMAMGAA